jgi:hypothetical protein
MLRALARILPGESGYSIVELLAVLSVSTVVIAALFVMIDVTLHQGTRTISRIDATQHARTELEQIVNELHSACLYGDSTPIDAGSTGTTLLFTSAYGNAIQPTPVQHQLTFNAATGKLTDTATGYTYLTNVSQKTGVPVFQYFAYQEPLNSQGQPYTDGNGNPYMMLLDGTTAVPGTSTIPTPQPLATPLTSTSAPTAVEVVITLVAGAQGGTFENTNIADAQDTVSDSVVLRLTPAPNHAGAGASFAPCE